MVIASARLSEWHVLATSVIAGLPVSVENRSEHAFANFGQNRSDIQFALDARRKTIDFFLRAWILQVIQCAAVGESRCERNKLQRGHLNSFAETGHTRYTAIARRLHGKRAGMLFRQIVSS